MTTDQLRLSIVIPAYNEAARLTEEAERLHGAVVTGAIDPSSTELIVVDDGSSDDTATRSGVEFGRSFSRIRVLKRKVNSGKGAAIRDGVAVAGAPVVLFMDADMAVDPTQIPSLVSATDSADVAIGSRSVPGSSVQSDNFRRAVMGRTFSRYVNLMTEMGIRDTQCGFKAFRTPVARLLFHCMTIDRFAFDVELLYLARRLRLQVAEVPIHWRDVDGSAVRPVVDPFSMVFDVLRMRVSRQSPLVPALSVNDLSRGERSPEGLRTQLSNMFGRTLPVVQRAPGRTDVLFPLSTAQEIDSAAVRIRELVPGSEVLQRLFSVDELMGTIATDPGMPDFNGEASQEMAPGANGFVHLSNHDHAFHQDEESLQLPGT